VPAYDLLYGLFGKMPSRCCAGLDNQGAVNPPHPDKSNPGLRNRWKMRAHILQHVPFEDIGSIGNWLDAQNADISYTRFFRTSDPPEPDSPDLLVILGGPMSVNDEDAFPWLRTEKAFIRDSVRRNIPTVGICLGAQLIASALGARVYRNPQKEIGWFEVASNPGMRDRFPFPDRFCAFHWHGETFAIPAGAVHLARSKGCENQAFQIGKHVVGLQFHLETTPEAVRALVDNCRHEIIPDTFIQTEEQLQQVPVSRYESIHSIMSNLLAYLTS
jgi:GMP synthase-like glutamine amidotransferase